MSTYGSWAQEHDLPVFDYVADQRNLPEAEWDPIVGAPTRRHFLALGNRRLQVVVDNEGGTCLWDEHDGLRWLVAPDPRGSGVSLLHEPGQPTWGTLSPHWPSGEAPLRRFGPTWFTVVAAHGGLRLDRSLLCPEGERPWVLIRVRITNTGRVRRAVRLVEQWALRPRFVNLLLPADAQRAAAATVSFAVTTSAGGLAAQEVRSAAAAPLAAVTPAQVFGPLYRLVLEAVDALPVRTDPGEGPHPVLSLSADLVLEPGATAERQFRFGIDDGPVADPTEVWSYSVAHLRARLPRAAAAPAPMAAREVPWHAALLTGGACPDGVLGGHTLDQASSYSFILGFNGAARDPLQHALPLIYCEPDLALSVLRNTCSWASTDGELPYGLDGAKKPWTWAWQPSDSPLWALWLAAEYGAATGDLAAFAEPVRYHPATGSEVASLGEHLRRQFRFFLDGVGRGGHGHVRLRNADWNDMATHAPGLDRATMIEQGESVLNSAMAAWVLPVWAALADRLGNAKEAAEARSLAVELRELVAGEWTGQWFRRARGPQVVLGEEDLWLEVQPWAILCGAATPEQSRSLLATIDQRLRSDSPLGARLRWPVPDGEAPDGGRGEGTAGGIWPSVNMTLVWAAARLDPALAWDEWRRMTLASHRAAYPHIWEGTLSGPDSFNAPESERPGRTWASRSLQVAMQSFPVNNLHSHSQPLLAYLRLLGVEPTPAGTLRVGTGGSWASPTFEVRADGTGRLRATGEVTVEMRQGEASGGPGELSW